MKSYQFALICFIISVFCLLVPLFYFGDFESVAININSFVWGSTAFFSFLGVFAGVMADYLPDDWTLLKFPIKPKYKVGRKGNVYYVFEKRTLFGKYKPMRSKDFDTLEKASEEYYKLKQEQEIEFYE